MDTFRGIAVIWVLLAHLDYFFNMKVVLGPVFSFFKIFAEVGYLGVDMFFVISGFLITGILIEDYDKEIRIKRFYTRRAFKILPQYFLAIFLVCAYILFASASDPNVIKIHDNSLKGIWSYFLFLQNFFEPLPILAHTWSLAIEEHFYLFYPCLIFVIFASTKDPSRRKTALIISLIILILAVNVYRMLYRAPIDAAYITHQTTFYRIDALMFGCIIKLVEPSLNKLKFSPWRPVTYLLLGIVMYYYLLYSGARHYVLLTFPISYLAPGGFLLAGLCGFGRHFNSRSLQYIGKHSYGIYLWHFILGVVLAPYFNTFPETYSVIAYIALSIGVGVLSTLTLEKFFLNLRENVAS